VKQNIVNIFNNNVTIKEFDNRQISLAEQLDIVRLDLFEVKMESKIKI
jgi:hypothetical protein